jgi:hypothetical protein
MTRREEGRSLVSTLLRLSALLFVAALVSFVGLNEGISPFGISRVQAHNIAIDLTSEGTDAIVFGAAVDCDADALAPGDSCTAHLQVQNTGDFRLSISLPVMTVTGTLLTCGGGGHFSAGAVNLTYPDGEVVESGDSRTFDVVVGLAFEAPNDCMAKDALITVVVNAECIDGDEGCNETDEEEETPTPTQTATVPLPSGTPPSGGGQFNGGSSGAPSSGGPGPSNGGSGRSSQTAGTTFTNPSRTFTSETLPSRLPVTGQGDSALEEQVTEIVKLVLIASGLIAAGLFITAIALYGNRRRNQP